MFEKNTLHTIVCGMTVSCKKDFDRGKLKTNNDKSLEGYDFDEMKDLNTDKMKIVY